MKSRKSGWSEGELKKLAAFVAAGGTLLRASVRFKRTMAACRNQARKIGVRFENLKIRRRNILEKCAAVERALPR
jgi:hypothetical protein